MLVVSFAQLQKLATKLGFAKAFTFDMDLLRFIDTLHEFTTQYNVHIVVKHHTQIHAAAAGAIVTTALTQDSDIWRVKTAAHASVWWLQNPSKPLESLATAIAEAAA